MPRSISNPDDPYDPKCETFAADMVSLDDDIVGVWGWDEDDGDPDTKDRILFVQSEEGTFNRANGHFLCMSCYIDAGMPSSPSVWKCP